MGLLRFTLAAWVIVAHCGGRFLGLRFGAPEAAVDSFFVISGFYMAMILSTRYRADLRAFYFNRFLRIFPTYWLALALFLGGFAVYRLVTGHERYEWVGWDPGLGSGKAWFAALFANLLIVGSDVFSWFRGARYFHYIAIPPIWSVSIEIFFYLLAPLIVRARMAAQVVLVVIGILLRIRLLGVHGNTFAPVALPLFLLGVLSYGCYARWIVPAALARSVGRVLAAAWVAVLCLRSGWIDAHEPTYLVLAAVALPFVFAGSKDSRADRWIAQWSYPIYVCHWLLIILAACLASMVPESRKVLFVFPLTLAVAALVLFCDERIQRRFKRTGRDSGDSRTGVRISEATAAPASAGRT